MRREKRGEGYEVNDEEGRMSKNDRGLVIVAAFITRQVACHVGAIVSVMGTISRINFHSQLGLARKGEYRT
jgi:hypothetical protein